MHLGSTQLLLKTLPKDDPEYVDIAEECKDQAIQMFVDATNQEKEWARYLFRDGSMIGLNEQVLSDYIEWITSRRMASVDLPSPYKNATTSNNPLPWTKKWISGMDVQVAPQEVTLVQYIIGGVKNDIDTDTFKGFSL